MYCRQEKWRKESWVRLPLQSSPHSAGTPRSAQHGEWSRPSARQENISGQPGIYIDGQMQVRDLVKLTSLQ